MAGAIFTLFTGITPPTPPAGYVTCFVDSADNLTKQIDEFGVVTMMAASGQIIYDDVATESEIVAMDPALFLGETWWAGDTKISYKAVIDLLGVEFWQPIGLLYDDPSDSFCLPITRDGQVQNLGQEVFFLGFNGSASGASELDPKVFCSIGSALADEKFQDVIKIIAGDLSPGDTFGINTTTLQPGDRGKVTTYGEVKNVNTSAWLENDILYVDSNTAGDLTNIQPAIDAFNVARVLKVHPTDGILFVQSISSNRIDSETLAIGIDFIFLTGDEEVTVAGTFYKALLQDEGAVTTATQLVVVPNNSLVGSSQDHLGDVFPTAQVITAGLREGQIEFEIDQSSAQEKVYAELYDADSDGVPIDSGILSQPVGDLGVRPVIVLSTSLLNLNSGVVVKESIRGLLDDDFSFATTHRIRTHFVCEKIGSGGGNKTFTLYFGSDHDSYLESIAALTFDTLTDTPSSKLGSGKRLVRVSEGEVDLEYVEPNISNSDGHADPAITGVLSGGTMTATGTTQVIVDAGSGRIVNFYSDYLSSNITEVSWPEETILIPNLGVDNETHIYIDAAGDIQTQSMSPAPIDDRTKIFLGFTINDTNISEVLTVIDIPAFAGGTSHAFSDYMSFIGASSRGGTVSQTGDVGTNGALATKVSAHNVYFPGSNWHADKSNPNEITYPETDPTIFDYLLQSGELVTENTTLIDPTQYDNSGVLTLVPTAGGGRRTTIQYMYQFVSGAYVVLFGQVVYDDIATAKDALSADAKSLIVPDAVKRYASPLAAIIVSQNCVNLTDQATADIVQVESGSLGGGGAGIEEAPIDGTPYVRQDASWVSESGGSGNQIETIPMTMAGGSNSPPTGQVKAISLWITTQTTITELEVEAVNSGSGDFIVGIYEFDTGTDYTLLERGNVAMSGAGFYTVTLDAPLVLSEGGYFIGILTPQTGGANPNIASQQITNNNLNRAFVSQQTALGDVPATVTAQNVHSDMYWIAIRG